MTISVGTLSDNRTMRFPFPASLAVSKGDLLYWDITAKQAKPLTSLTTGASEAIDQATVASIFLGVANDVRLSTESDNNAIRVVNLDVVCDVDCVSMTPYPGTLVGATWNGGTALVNQFVKSVTTLDKAIGVVVDVPTQTGNSSPWGTATTSVRVRFQSRMCWDLLTTGTASTPGANATSGTGGAGEAISLTTGGGGTATTGTGGAGGAYSITTGAGGNASAAAGTGGAGGAYAITAGAGGTATTGTGGAGGAQTLTSGAGGAASGVAGTGGAGGAYTITAGAGGATAGTGASVGGAGGAFTLAGGAGGAAAAGTGNGGAGGPLVLNGGAGGTSAGGTAGAQGLVKIANNVAPPAAGSAGAFIQLSSTASFGIYFGSGAPTVSAAQGSIYLRTDGSSTSTRMYINTTGSTTWTNVTTAA